MTSISLGWSSAYDFLSKLSTGISVRAEDYLVELYNNDSVEAFICAPVYVPPA